VIIAAQRSAFSRAAPVDRCGLRGLRSGQRHDRNDREPDLRLNYGLNLLRRARAELVERGAEVSEVQRYDGAVLVGGRGGDWNSFVLFSDADGNRCAVQERPAATDAAARGGLFRRG
jgi:hypothetical protein